MTGVILAGGTGSRLRPATLVTNKHLMLVYDRPMIYYPLRTLVDMGCTDIILVSGGDHVGSFVELLKDGHDFGVNITYRVQPEAGGIAQALGCVGKIKGLFPVILGDNYFETSPKMPKYPSIFLKQVDNPEHFGVYDPALNTIIEKPEHVNSNWAVTGLYVYDDRVFDVIPTLEPSQRGELEVTDINNWYLKREAAIFDINGYWSDMGTFDTLHRTAHHIYEKLNNAGASQTA